MLLSLLLAAVLIQDPTVEDHVRSLSSDDAAVRERAARALETLGLDKLPEMEKQLTHANAEVASQVRSAMGNALASKLGSRKFRLEVRPVAPDATTTAWIAAGADPENTPKGFEARRCNPDALKGRSSEWSLVGPPIATEDGVRVAEPEPGIQLGRDGKAGWNVRVEFNAEAAARFDAMASELFALNPRGKCAFLVDGRIAWEPIIQSEKFGGKLVIGSDNDEKAARDLARVIKGRWLDSSMRAEKIGEGSTDKLVDFLQTSVGFDKVKIAPVASGVDVTGLLDLKEADLVSVWQSMRERGFRLVPRK